jgi:hypothetical protein
MPKTLAAHTPGQPTPNQDILLLVLEEIENRCGYLIEEVGCKSFDEIVAVMDEKMPIIASAPELLEALEGVIHHDNALKPQWKLPESLVRQVKAAIAKAKGEACA